VGEALKGSAEAAAAARELKAAMASRGPDAENQVHLYMGKLWLLGEPGIEPLCRVVPDPKWGGAAVYDLAAADRVPPGFQARAAALLVTADANSRRQIETAAHRHMASAEAVLRLMNLWSLPPAEAAKQIIAMDDAQKQSVLRWLPADEKRTTPVLVMPSCSSLAASSWASAASPSRRATAPVAPPSRPAASSWGSPGSWVCSRC